MEQGEKERASATVRTAPTADAIVARLRTDLESLASEATHRRRVKKLLQVQVELAFAYWAKKYGHHRALLDPKRETMIRKRLTENGGDLSEVLYAIDGAERDEYLEKRGWRLDLILRDRATLEEYAARTKGYRQGDLHRMAAKYGAQQADTE